MPYNSLTLFVLLCTCVHDACSLLALNVKVGLNVSVGPLKIPRKRQKQPIGINMEGLLASSSDDDDEDALVAAAQLAEDQDAKQNSKSKKSSTKKEKRQTKIKTTGPSHVNPYAEMMSKGAGTRLKATPPKGTSKLGDAGDAAALSKFSYRPRVAPVSSDRKDSTHEAAVERTQEPSILQSEDTLQQRFASTAADLPSSQLSSDEEFDEAVSSLLSSIREQDSSTAHDSDPSRYPTYGGNGLHPAYAVEDNQATYANKSGVTSVSSAPGHTMSGDVCAGNFNYSSRQINTAATVEPYADAFDDSNQPTDSAAPAYIDPFDYGDSPADTVATVGAFIDRFNDSKAADAPYSDGYAPPLQHHTRHRQTTPQHVPLSSTPYHAQVPADTQSMGRGLSKRQTDWHPGSVSDVSWTHTGQPSRQPAVNTTASRSTTGTDAYQDQQQHHHRQQIQQQSFGARIFGGQPQAAETNRATTNGGEEEFHDAFADVFGSMF